MNSVAHKTHAKHHAHLSKIANANRTMLNSLNKMKLSSSLLPKKINKKLTFYVTKRPYQSAGIATLFAGVVIGLLWARKYF